MRTLAALLLTACSAFAQQASVNVQGTAERSYITFWTENRGYVTAEVRQSPVQSLLITDQRGNVIIDTYVPKAPNIFISTTEE